MDKTYRFIFFTCISLLVAYYLFSLSTPSRIFDEGNGKFYSKKDLIDNYEKNTLKLLELLKFYNDLVPTDKVVEIEFKNSEEIAQFTITYLTANTDNDVGEFHLEEALNINSLRMESIIKSLGWTHKTLTLLKTYLDQANCISIKNGEPTKIGFQRSGFGMYFYDVFINSIPDNMKRRYNDSCTHIIYKDKVVLEYGGGVYGPQCFSK